MKNGKDKSIIKLLVLFIAYFLINKFFPGLTNSKMVNIIIKDSVFMLTAILIYLKELGTDYRRFRKSDKKLYFVIYAILIYAIMYGLLWLSHKYIKGVPSAWNGLRNYGNVKHLFSISWYYALFRLLVYTSIAELIMFNLSFRKIINNDVVYVILSSLAYTFFGYIVVGFKGIHLIYLLFVKFIPYVLYNIAYLRSNNLASLMFINVLCNMVPIVLFFVM